jgi:hypothetical protein
MTSEDGHEFDNMLCLTGEVPPLRYWGWAKNKGPQYIRGIFEGLGDPPGNHMWNTFSVGKEDIWVTRTHIPITGVVDEHVNQDFEGLNSEADLELWNLYVPRWAPVTVEQLPGGANSVLQLRDEDPHDYAVAERAFPPSSRGTVEFSIYASLLGKDVLEFELHNEKDQRPLRLRFDPTQEGMTMDHGGVEPWPVPFQANRWYDLKLVFDCQKGSYDIWMDGNLVSEDIELDVEVATLERMVFRTGTWRSDVRQYFLEGEPAAPGVDFEDLAGSGVKSAATVYWIDNVRTK